MGRIYADAEQLRPAFSEMFDDVADDDGNDGLVAQQMEINFRLHGPSIDIWVDSRTRPGSRSRALRLGPLLHARQAVYPGIVDRRLWEAPLGSVRATSSAGLRGPAR